MLIGSPSIGAWLMSCLSELTHGSAARRESCPVIALRTGPNPGVRTAFAKRLTARECSK